MFTFIKNNRYLRYFSSLIFPPFCLHCQKKMLDNRYLFCLHCRNEVISSFLSDEGFVNNQVLYCFDRNIVLDTICQHIKQQTYPYLIKSLTGFMYFRLASLLFNSSIKFKPYPIDKKYKTRKLLIYELSKQLSNYYYSKSSAETIWIVDTIDMEKVEKEEKILALYRSD